MIQPVSEILVFDHKPSTDNQASLVDIIPLDMNVSEAAQWYRTHWSGGKFRFIHDHNDGFVAIRAGWRIETGEQVMMPGYGALC